MQHESLIPYGRQSIDDEDINAVIKVLKSDSLTQGPAVAEFENIFNSYIGSKYAVAVTNGTAALHLGALALNIQPGQKVITTPITFVASANSVLYCGGEIEFADIDPSTFCLDANKVETLLKKNPDQYSGIIPVDFAGYPVAMDDFRFLAEKYNLWIMEDACHAPGASYFDKKGNIQKSGNSIYADLAVYSFHPVKHIACGEGGMITTNNEELYKKLQLFRTHGITKDPSLMSKSDGGWYYEMQQLGFNYRISDILCALGTSQMKRINQSFERRQEIAKKYQIELAGLPLKLPQVGPGAVHAYHLYVVLEERRKDLYEHLKRFNIHCQVHYIPVHQQPYYVQKYGHQTFENADRFYSTCLSLPMYHSLTSEEQSRVIRTVREFYGQ